MAEEKQLSEAEREGIRKSQKAVLESKVKDLYVAAVTNVGKKGMPGHDDRVKEMTYSSKYLDILKQQAEKPDESVSKLQAMAAYNAEMQAKSQEKKPGEAVYGAMELFRNTMAFYEIAINKVKVKDILELMPETKRYEDLGEKDLDMFMEDFKEKNKELYSAIFSVYLTSIVDIGVGESQIGHGKNTRKSLEGILSEKADEAKKKAEEEKKKSEESSE